MPTVYKIRRLSDGKFSTGTSNPRWTSVGRIFANRSALLSHIRVWKKGPLYQEQGGDLVHFHQARPNLADYEVVVYELIEVSVQPLESL